ncbi:hypothetical protein [Streptacidiphilus carbonis]|uniref:hypothetical protein n=1 Tax=Streptacidiphilus carbonis TaxID=105422 RepID=UPI001F219004|nr:hypothetical protein [Streptacidiphilus carbonis]
MSTTMRPPGRVKVWMVPEVAEAVGGGLADAGADGLRDGVVEPERLGVGDRLGDGMVTAEPMEVGSGGGVGDALVGVATATTSALGCS